MEAYLGSPAMREESREMWNLNKRLEAYLSRVQSLEEENELLRVEIQDLKGSQAQRSWRNQFEEEVGALRDTLNERFREKALVEFERDSLLDELEQVKGLCQMEREAQEDAKKELAENKKALEEEKRTHMWLKEKALQLELELEALVEVHEADRAELEQEIATFSQSMENFRVAPVAYQPVDIEDYSQRLSAVWKGAVETYKSEVSSLEATLAESKQKLQQVADENRQNQAQLQSLEKELSSLKARKAILEERLSREWQDQQDDIEKFQVDIDSLEEEKQALRTQIAHVLEDRQQLMHLKMSLSLEVATYRSLLEAESTRMLMPYTDSKPSSPFRESRLELSSSPIHALSPDPRKYPKESRYSSSAFQKVETKSSLQKNQHRFPAVKMSNLSKSPLSVTDQTPKVNQVLKSQKLKYTHASTPPKSVPEPKGNSVNLSSLRSEDVVTNINVQAVSKTKLASVTTPVERPSEELKLDVSEDGNTVIDSHTDQKPKEQTDKLTLQEGLEEIKAVEQQKTPTITDRLDETHSLDEGSALQEEVYSKKLPTETLEETGKKVEDEEELVESKIHVVNTQASLMKAMGSTFDIPSNEVHLDEACGIGLPHLDSTAKEVEKPDEMEKQIEISEQASTEVTRETFLEPIEQQEESAKETEIAEPIPSKDTHEEHAEHGLVEQEVYEETQLSDIPSADQAYKMGVKDEIIDFEMSQYQNEDLKMLSKKNEEISDQIVQQEEHLLETGLKASPEDESDGNKVSMDEHDIPKDMQGNAEELYRLETPTEAKETRAFQMTEEENLRELASAAEDTEDYDAVSDVQESMFFKTESLSAEELTEVMPNETLEHVVADQLMSQGGELEEDMLTDTDDFTEDQEIDDGMEEITEHEIQSVRISENFGVNENIRELENTNLFDNVEGAANIIHDNDISKHETFDVTENILQYPTLKAEGRHLESETEYAKEIPSEQESLIHENLEDNQRILSQETVGQKHNKDLISQEGPLVAESELVSKTEGESMHSLTEPMNNDPPQGLRSSDDFLISAEKMQWGNEQESKINLDLSDEILNNDSEELLQMENVTEHRAFDQDIKFDQDQGISEEHMNQNKAEHKDTENDESSIENSCKEISEAEIEALSETEIEEEHKVGVAEDKESKEVTEEQEGVKSLTSVTDTYQMQTEFVEFGGSVDTQPEFTDQITESEIYSVNKQELEHRKEYSLEETLPDASLLPRYDEEIETPDLEIQGSVQLLTQVNKEPDFTKVHDQSQQEEILHDIQTIKDIVQNDASGDILDKNEQPEDLNNVALLPKETSKQDIIEDESFVYPEPNQEEKNILEHQEATEQKDLISSTHVTDVYQMQSQYSESEDSIDSQNSLLQDDISQSETVNIAIQEVKNTNEYPLDNNLPDTVLTLNLDDETEVPVLEKQLHVEMLTQVNKGEDLIHDEETHVEQVLSSEEIPISLEATHSKIEPTLSNIAAETEKEISEADISVVETTENQEENQLEDFDSKHGFTDECIGSRFSADGQGVLDESPECEMPTIARTISNEDEELFEEAQGKSLGDPKDVIVENEALKASQMGDICQERFDNDEIETERLITEIPLGSSLTLTQDEGHFHDIIDKPIEQTQDVVEKSEAFTVSETTVVYQETFEKDVTQTSEPEPELKPNTVTLSREEEGVSEDLGVELSEQAKIVFEESDGRKQSELKEINHDELPCVETKAQGLESEIPSAADCLPMQVEGNFKDVFVESQVQEDEVIEEDEDFKASHVRNQDQENADDGVTESQELESEIVANTAKLSMQNDAHIENVAAESIEYSETPFEEEKDDKVAEIVHALQDKCDNDEGGIDKLISETVTNTVSISTEDNGVSEDVSIEAPEFTEFINDEVKIPLASEHGEINQEQFDNEHFQLELKSEQNVTVRKFDSLHIPGGALGTGYESVLEQVSAEVEEHQNPSALITIDNKSELDHDNQKAEIFHSDSEDSILSEEESPNVTKTADHSEHEIIMSRGSDLTRVSNEANENTEVTPSIESKDLEYQQEIVAQEHGEQVLISQQDVLPVSNIDDLYKDTDYPTQNEEGLSEQLPETADESVESIDVLVGESEVEALEERFVIKHENFLLTPMQFTSESHILGENADGLNGFHNTLDIEGPPTFRKEMLNGHSSVDESQELDLINQESQEHLENDFKSQPQSDLSPKTVLIHEAYAEETFAFPKTDESQKLFQKLLGASNQQETSHIEDHVHSSEEEPTSEDDQNGNANSSPNAFSHGNDWDDQHQQASKKAIFDDGHSLFETNQASKDTIDKISGLKSSHNIDDAWSSEDD